MTDHPDIVVDDNLLTISQQETIKSTLENDFFPWYIGQNKVGTSPAYITTHFHNITKNIFESTQLVHNFITDRTVVSSAVDIPMMIYNAAKEKYNFSNDILRIKANLYPQVWCDNVNAHQTPHIDDHDTHWTMIYYVDDSDGDTFLFDQHVEFCKDVTSITNLTVATRIMPVQGRCVFFKGNRLHAGMHPRNTNYRMVINFNFKN
jgi:hypothetical protein